MSYGTIAGIAIDVSGNLHLTAPYNATSIIQISPSGVLTNLGSGLSHPSGLAVDQTGNVYVAISNDHTIDKVTSSGTVAVIAGLAAERGSADGIGTAARFSSPNGMAADSTGNIYVTDVGNALIRKISAIGAVTTLVGTSQGGFKDGTGPDARFAYISSLAVDVAGNIFVSDEGNHAIRKVTLGGVVTTVAGSPESSYPNVDGKGSDARFDAVHGAALDRNGNLYVAGLSTIRKISPAGDVSTIAGSATTTGTADGNATDARFFQPFGLAVDKTDNIFVADSYNHTIRKISPDGRVSTIAGAPGKTGATDGIGTAARFSYPAAMTVDATGNLYIADAGNNLIRLMTLDGTVSTVAGKAQVSGSEDGMGSAARFNSPSGIALDQSGNLFLADTLNHAIRKGMLAGPPKITTQPQSGTVSPSSSVQFSVTANGVPEPTYQWYFNGGVFSGATNSIFSFTNARSTDAGDYTVVVTNSLGSLTSNKATLTVSDTPVVNPTPTPASAGGGGSVDAWFALALVALGATRVRKIFSSE